MRAVARAMDSAIKTFFSSPHFAVAGASEDTSKYGHKVFAWYLSHGLDVTGINPKTPTILNQQTISSIDKLPNPRETSLSFITGPKITLSTLKTAKEIGIPAVWCQPGSFDQACLDYAKENDIVMVAGGGACVLVDGETGLKMAGRETKL